MTAQALLDQDFLPAIDLGRRGGNYLCSRPIVFDQLEDWIDARGRQRGHGRRGVRRGGSRSPVPGRRCRRPRQRFGIGSAAGRGRHLEIWACLVVACYARCQPES
jgi:hypothetical protein